MNDYANPNLVQGANALKEEIGTNVLNEEIKEEITSEQQNLSLEEKSTSDISLDSIGYIENNEQNNHEENQIIKANNVKFKVDVWFCVVRFVQFSDNLLNENEHYSQVYRIHILCLYMFHIYV